MAQERLKTKLESNIYYILQPSKEDILEDGDRLEIESISSQNPHGVFKLISREGDNIRILADSLYREHKSVFKELESTINPSDLLETTEVVALRLRRNN